MNLVDKSPGGFLVATFAFVYGVVLVETWMLGTASLVAMGATMALIIALSGVLVRFMNNLMGSEEYSLGHELAVAQTAAPAPQTVEAPSAERHRPVATGRPALTGR